jgi:hypothetical protein
MYILIILKKVGYSREYPGIQLPPPMSRNGLLEFVDLSDTNYKVMNLEMQF